MARTMCIVRTMIFIIVFVSTTCVMVRPSAEMALMKMKSFVEVSQYSNLRTVFSFDSDKKSLKLQKG